MSASSLNDVSSSASRLHTSCRKKAKGVICATCDFRFFLFFICMLLCFLSPWGEISSKERRLIKRLMLTLLYSSSTA